MMEHQTARIDILSGQPVSVYLSGNFVPCFDKSAAMCRSVCTLSNALPEEFGFAQRNSYAVYKNDKNDARNLYRLSILKTILIPPQLSRYLSC
jgi:hypothetical protein